MKITEVPLSRRSRTIWNSFSDFGWRQRRGRLVENEQFQIRDEGSGDLDELKLGHREFGDERIRIDANADSGKQFSCPRDDGLAIDRAESPSPASRPC